MARSKSAFGRGAKQGVARLDRVAQVAQLVRQTDLPQLGMAALGVVEIGYPDLRPVPAQHLPHHRPAAARPDDVEHHRLVLEHPVPAAPAVDPHCGLVGTDHPGTPQAGEDGGGLAQERLATDDKREIVSFRAGGPYVIAGAVDALLEQQPLNEGERTRLTAWITDQRRDGEACPLVTSWILATVLGRSGGRAPAVGPCYPAA
jgi:hypothetical protein